MSGTICFQKLVVYFLSIKMVCVHFVFCFTLTLQPSRFTDLYHVVAILVIFPVSTTVMNANIHCAKMAPDYYLVQPQFGYNEFDWSKIKMSTP